jgi:recombination protein RecA
LAWAALRLLPAASSAAPTLEEATPLHALVAPGRLVELSAPPEGMGARTSTAVALLRRAQREGETTAWVQPVGGLLYPPDLHDAGVDLEALVVVHVPVAEGAAGLAKAAELLLRSGAFGMVVIDLGALEAAGAPGERPRPGRSPKATAGTSWQGRLLGLARQHEARVLLLTDKPSHADSLGPLVGLRVEPRRTRLADGTFGVEPHVLKNKSGAPVAPALDRFVGPPGLR